MHGMIAAKNRTQFGTRQQTDHRQAARQGLNLLATPVGAVGGRQQHAAATGPQFAADLFEPAHRLSGSSGQADQFETAGRQLPFDKVRETGWNIHLPAGGSGERAFSGGRIYHIPVCAQP